MKPSLRKTVALLLAFLFLLTIPHSAQAADHEDDNLNKGVLVGVFCVVVGILFWLGFKSDFGMDSYAEKIKPPPSGGWTDGDSGIAGTPQPPVKSPLFLVSADGLSIAF